MGIHMHQFFVEPSQIQNKTVYIYGKDVNHIKNVLRMKTGEEISISNGIDDREYRCAIQTISEDEVICELRFIKESAHELPVKVTLFQGLPKSDKMELIIQKAVELGVFEIVPVVTSRTIVKLDAKKARAKNDRWQMISETAAKQSKRAIIPNVKLPMSFSDALKYAENMKVKLIPYEMAEGMDYTREVISKINKGDSVAVFIGPEGGFSESEIKLSIEQKVEPITLGKRILRTETAGMCVLSILLYQLEE